MTRPARRIARPLALALAAALVVAPLLAARPARADEPAGSSGSGGVASTVNKAFALLFMVFKLAEILQASDLPPQGGAPPPQWGSHPGPLPVTAPAPEESEISYGATMPLAP